MNNPTTLAVRPMLTIALDVNASQDEWMAAMDRVAAQVGPAEPDMFVDHGTVQIWSWVLPAAA